MDLGGGKPDKGGVGALVEHQQRVEIGAGQGFSATGAATDVPVPTRRRAGPAGDGFGPRR